ncbi:DUF6403 family protein [Dactylosporangium sp. NPDC051484]|uniref:DUF6403 family protein n=1 Tax=Dactylosporangium sp. NPDC051484 TaxID=3154942 RepID=UPI00345079D1
MRVVSAWPVWLIGVLLLVAAGFAATFVPRWRAGARDRAVAWSGARAAIDVATISRDAAAGRVVEADELLARAEAITAGRGGENAAREAARCAREADRLWREAAGA